MKKVIYILITLLISCSNKQTEKNSLQKTEEKIENKFAKQNSSDKNDVCWRGTLNSKTPDFIHYQIKANLIIGEITYLNTKDRKAIKIIGTIEEDKNYRILEFENNGNITGIITGLPAEHEFIGQWFSPKTRKKLDLKLTKSDTIIQTKSIETALKNIYGDYHYQYSEAGYQGDFNITKIDNVKSSFNIFSVTGEPSRNMADIETDTIKLSDTKFIYKVPETDNCEFKVSFFKDFVYINYTKGYCDGQFGMNATIDGIYYKIRRK